MLRVLLAHLRVILASTRSSLHDANRLHAEFGGMIDRARAAEQKIRAEIRSHEALAGDAWSRYSKEVRAASQKASRTASIHRGHINALATAERKASTLATNLTTLLTPAQAVIPQETAQ